MSLAAGTRIGPYEIVAPIGAGGMGEVYRARDTRLDRDVAIKVLPEAFASDAERLARFTREAQTLASLNHPCIAAIYGIEETPGGLRALVMELVAGDDLTVAIARGPLPPDEALPIAAQIAEALEAAHEQGVVHRDLKPANVKVRPDGTAKVLDFGLAKAIDGHGSSHASGGSDGAIPPTLTSPAMTERGVVLGTAAYMSPEQAKGRPVDKRSDIWAFGVVLHEMLTGRRLFQGDSVAETLAAVLTREPDLAGLPGTVPLPVVALLRRCLERDPKKRLRDIGEARLLLSEGGLRTGSPGDSMFGGVTAPTSSGMTPATAPAARPTRRQLLVAATGMAGAFAGGYASRAFLDRSPTASAAAPALATRPLTTSGTVISASISGDGRYLAYVESEQGRQSLWIQQLASGQSLRLVPDDNVAYWGHTFTPDGNRVVFGQKTSDDINGALYAISTLGGSPTRLIGDIDSQPTFSPDGTRMAFLRLRHPAPGATALIVANTDGTGERALASVTLPEYMAGIFFGAPAWSPDGRTIATAVGRRGSADAEARARLVLVSVDTGAMTTLSDPGWPFLAQAGWMPDGRSLLVIARAADEGLSQIWAVSASDGTVRRVTSNLTDYRIISLTADGQSLVTVGSEGSAAISTMPVKGGRPTRMSRSTRDGLGGVAFTREGGLVYTSPTADGVSLWQVDAGGATRSPVVPARRGESPVLPVVLDDGSILYVVRKSSGAELCLLPRGASTARVLARDVRVDSVGASTDGRVIVYGALVEGMPSLFRIGLDGASPTRLTRTPSFGPSVDRSGTRVAFYHVSQDSGIRLGIMSLNGGPLLLDLPAEPPTANSRLGLTEAGLYLDTVRNDRANVWLQPLDGGPMRRVTDFEDQVLYDFAVSRDGQTLAIVRGPRLRDAQLITGFEALLPS